MKIKTLHITNFYHPKSGGIRIFYHALLAAANRHGRFVRLVVPAEKTWVEEVGAFGRIYHVAAPRSPVLDSRYRCILPHAYAWPYNSDIRRILSDERPDIIEICDKFFLLYLAGALRRGWISGVPVPVIVGLSCERLDNNVATYMSDGPIIRALYRWYMRNCYAPRFDFHLAASEYIADEVRTSLPARLKDRLCVAPMGVDFDTFSRPSESSALRDRLLKRAGGNQQTILLLYAGRLSKEKNLGIIPPILARLATSSRDYRLIIAGDGPFGDTLRLSQENLAPGRTVFLGHCRTDFLPGLYHAADIFIHPNPREPFGIAPLEAMAAGLALVAPASGGVLTYANRDNAWLAEDTPESFADAVQSVHADISLRRKKVEQAKRTAETFSWPRVTQNYFDIYDNFYRLSLHHSSVEAPASAAAVSSNQDPRPAGIE
jgi:glycosyltransferase involved in cell wall biosynthesis